MGVVAAILTFDADWGWLGITEKSVGTSRKL
jgi:hypothetical protein